MPTQRPLNGISLSQRPQRMREYEIIEGPYNGTYGSVLIGVHNTLKIVRAFKKLLPHVRTAVIKQEALKLKLVTSPYVIQIFDFFEDEKAIVMEYCPIGLETYLKNRFRQTNGKLPIEEARQLLQYILQGLIDAHSSGIIHGDIKPANVRFGTGKTDDDIGYPKLGDFGAARGLKQSGLIIPGSNNWMAPELLDGGKASKSSDYFAFGILAYLILSGKHPFFANDPSCLTSEEDNIKDKTFLPDDLSSLRPDIPSRIASLIMGLLSRDPEPRERVAEQLKVALSESLEPIKESPKPSPTPIEAALDEEESELINKSIEQARLLFFHYYDAWEAVQVLDNILEAIDWKRFKHKNITGIADCWSLRAYFLNARRSFKEAVESATNGLLIEANHVNSFHARAYAYTQLGDYTKAKTDLEKALKLCHHYTKERQLKQLLATIEDRLKSPERLNKG